MNFKWGIIGTGGIAKEFVRDFTFTSGHQVLAVGSRNQASADRFASDMNISRAYGSHESIVSDPEIDAIYVATPHPNHLPATLLALEAGKPVLCEKPFAMSADETRSMISKAREKNVMLMEAMWTRFLPHIVHIRSLLANKVLGEIVSVEADHGQWFAEDPQFRLFNPELGGGALLDLGVYPVSFAHMVLGVPDSISSTSTPAFTGVDGQTSAIFSYSSGAQAVLTCTLRAATPCRAVITGTLGRIEIDTRFYAVSPYRIIMRDGSISEFPRIYDGRGSREEAIEFARCVRAGLQESPMMRLSETLEIMESMDEIRKQIGLVY